MVNVLLPTPLWILSPTTLYYYSEQQNRIGGRLNIHKLSQKANQTYVTSELELKADKTDVTSELELKANQTEDGGDDDF